LKGGLGWNGIAGNPADEKGNRQPRKMDLVCPVQFWADELLLKGGFG